MEAQVYRSRKLLALMCWAAVSLVAEKATAAGAEAPASTGEAEWIWAPSRNHESSAAATCYFRKTFEVHNAESARVHISCDDRYELYVNGRRVGQGSNWKVLDSYDVRGVLQNGRNVIAVRAANVSGTSMGLVAQVLVKWPGHTDVAFSTNSTWKVSTRETPGWERAYFNDSSWVEAFSLGEFGSAEPWGDQVKAASGTQSKRFMVTRDFRVERVLKHQSTGSLVAMTFNEWGEILAARERGPLLLVIDKNKDGIPETVTTYCDQITNAQGLLALNGDVYATADGPQGAALYRLQDQDRDGHADKVTALIEFNEEMGEHGPHAVTLGPDGLIYVMVGNHSAVKKPLDGHSPYRHSYEGDLPQPKYEDANGHGAGIKAPGGTVVRTDTEGSFVQRFAGGLRNAYDMAFNDRGDLFTSDSDMEWDVGLPWYRPTRVLQIAAGGEFGWRSGWSAWPDYYLDSLPPTLNTSRGSPSGTEVYDHHMYPPPYHHALFVGDWSQGRILVVRLKPSGAGYEAEAEVFLQGRPLNVTDLAVGPDGWLYFSTGGRSTEGGVYRIVWNGRAVPPSINNPLLKAVRQPQANSAWARQKIAGIQEQMGDQWGRQLLALAENVEASANDRCRALDITQLYGPVASGRILLRLTEDPQPTVRAKAAALLGIQTDEGAGSALARLLEDPEAAVRRAACESIVRGGYSVPLNPLMSALSDADRYVAFAARRALEEFPVSEWQESVLATQKIRPFLMGSTALLTVEPNKKSALAVARRAGFFMKNYLSDADFLDLLRVLELSVVQGKLTNNDVPELCRGLAEEYPASEWRMNRELLRLLGQLQEPNILGRLLETLRGSSPEAEKIHAALCARFIPTGWTTEQKLELISFLEEAWHLEAGLSLPGYLENIERDFVRFLTEAEREQVLAKGADWPSAALGAIMMLPEHPQPQVIQQLITLDRQLHEREGLAVTRLQTGIIAILARSGDENSLEFLREAFERQPERRQDLAMGLAQTPDGPNWPLLVRSVPVLEGASAQEVLAKLGTVQRRPESPEALRQVILCGLKLGPEAHPAALQLLEKWTDQKFAKDDKEPFAAWQKWFAEKYPDSPPASLPTDVEGSRWTMQDLQEFLNGPEGAEGTARQGRLVFEKAQCSKCHRFAGRGESIGPDLSTIGQRFQKREILESILHPSQVISDQYASKTVTTTEGLSYTGMVGSSADGALVVLEPTGKKVHIPRDQVDEIVPSRKSAMPEGLLNSLSLEEIADLFAYLATGTAKR